MVSLIVLVLQMMLVNSLIYHLQSDLQQVQPSPLYKTQFKTLVVIPSLVQVQYLHQVKHLVQLKTLQLAQ